MLSKEGPNRALQTRDGAARDGAFAVVMLSGQSGCAWETVPGHTDLTHWGCGHRRGRELRKNACAQELAERDSLEDGPLLDGATFHNLARQCRLEPRWHEQVKRCLSHAHPSEQRASTAAL